jgi:hypothetical protein
MGTCCSAKQPPNKRGNDQNKMQEKEAKYKSPEKLVKIEVFGNPELNDTIAV